jgi:hypothetical protein
MTLDEIDNMVITNKGLGKLAKKVGDLENSLEEIKFMIVGMCLKYDIRMKQLE